jgi:hypothetical protein
MTYLRADSDSKLKVLTLDNHTFQAMLYMCDVITTKMYLIGCCNTSKANRNEDYTHKRKHRNNLIVQNYR